MKFIFPDFNNSILNVSASIASYLGCKNDKPTLKLLDDELSKKYNNIVFMCIDGLGINPIKLDITGPNIG